MVWGLEFNQSSLVVRGDKKIKGYELHVLYHWLILFCVCVGMCRHIHSLCIFLQEDLQEERLVTPHCQPVSEERGWSHLTPSPSVMREVGHTSLPARYDVHINHIYILTHRIFVTVTMYCYRHVLRIFVTIHVFPNV